MESKNNISISQKVTQVIENLEQQHTTTENIKTLVSPNGLFLKLNVFPSRKNIRAVVNALCSIVKEYSTITTIQVTWRC